MKIDIVTIFPGMVEAPLAEGMVGRAIAAGLLDLQVHDLRDSTTDRHRVVDDMPFGGGPGMVLKPEPLFAAVDGDSRAERGRSRGAVILTSPDGERFTHATAARLSALGSHRGAVRPLRRGGRAGAKRPGDRGDVDRRLRVVGRRAGGAGDRRLRWRGWCPGVVGDEASVARDTFAARAARLPAYTRPAEFRGHAGAAGAAVGAPRGDREVAPAQALARTLAQRRTCWSAPRCDAEDEALLKELRRTRRDG